MCRRYLYRVLETLIYASPKKSMAQSPSVPGLIWPFYMVSLVFERFTTVTEKFSAGTVTTIIRVLFYRFSVFDTGQWRLTRNINWMVRLSGKKYKHKQKKNYRSYTHVPTKSEEWIKEIIVEKKIIIIKM